MVVMEEVVCLGSRAEVPGTRGVGMGEGALGRETTRKSDCNSRSGENVSGP